MFNVLRRLGVIVLVVCAVARPAGAEDAVKIAVLGDSLSAGFGLMAHEAFPAQLEARLRELGVEVSVLNAGVSGDTSAGGVARVDWVLGDNPHFVILELGANDGLRGLDTGQMQANLAAIIETLQARGVRVLLAGMVAPANLGRDYGQAFNAVYPALAQRYAVPLYPFFLDGVAGDPSLNLDDGIHPTAAGVAVIVDAILPYVLDWLAGD
ncbi:MAG: arylesterase [Alphaproteobacteria bacterium]